MNNLKLWLFLLNRNPQTYFDIVDYWYEWIFQKELTERALMVIYND